MAAYRQFHSRLAFILGGLLILFGFLVFQFFRLQIVEGKKWASVAKTQHQKSVKTPYKRGKILGTSWRPYVDKQEKHPLLVFDVLAYHLLADTSRIPLACHSEMAASLDKIFNGESLKPFLMVNLAKRSKGRTLKKWVSEGQKKQVQQWWRYFASRHGLPRNALFFKQDYRRSYPFGSLLGSVLSAVRDDRDPKTQKQFPVGGIELAFDAYLQGSPGEKRQLKSLNNPLLVTEVVAQAKDGHDIVLNIDPYIQAICEEEIEKNCIQTGAKKGSCIIMDPNTGAVLALAQYPFFDPANYKTYYNTGQMELARLTSVSDPLEPGSTFKPITMAITLLANQALEKAGKPPLFDPNKMCKIGDGLFRGRRHKPLKDVSSHAYLNMFHAIEKSSNIYIAQLIERMVELLGDGWYKEQIETVFGFGHKTGIDFPSESSGFVPALDGFYASGAKQWSLATPYSLGFGYNLNVNALQMLKAWSILINGGYPVTPHLVSYVKKEEEAVALHSPDKGERVLPQAICDDIKKALFFVCQSPRGTGRRSKVAGYSMGGKTSTTEKLIGGQYAKGHNIATMMGFTPYEKPRLLIYLSFDDPSHTYRPGIGRLHFGGLCAAPPFKRIFKRVADYLGLPPDDPGSFSPLDKRYEPVSPLLEQEMQELTKLYSKWNY